LATILKGLFPYACILRNEVIVVIELNKLQVLSFEIGSECNLTKQHQKCPINTRVYNTEYGKLTTEIIVITIKEAEKLGFQGHVAFHFYNEPLLYIDKIKEVITAKPDSKYLLWTNGLLLKTKIEENDILNYFDKVFITCYYKDKMEHFLQLKQHYGNIEIASWELDNRMEIYSNDYTNIVGCKRAQFELPIDHYGNLHLCARDWKNTHKLGNIINDSLTDIIYNQPYQTALKSITRRTLDRDNCPDVCKSCDDPWFMVRSVSKTKMLYS
jgi:MoaA/NifB/PqqE/SkfB family radical SAM enzyme